MKGSGKKRNINIFSLLCRTERPDNSLTPSIFLFFTVVLQSMLKKSPQLLGVGGFTKLKSQD